MSPLPHGGTSQAERELPALSGDYVKIDESEYADWIVFAEGFSQYLAYHAVDGNEYAQGWQAFFARDVAAVLGTFAVQDIDSYREELGSRLAFLRDDDHAADVDALKTKLSEAFSIVLTLVQSVDTLYSRLPAGHAFKETLRSIIASQLGPALRRLLSYLKGAESAALYSAVTGGAPRVLNAPLRDALTLAAQTASLSSDWQASSATTDDSVFRGTTPFEKASHAANHFLFTSAFDVFTQAYAKLIDEAKTALLSLLDSKHEDDNAHQPHYALFLAFLALFRSARDKLNAIGDKHLDFYYRDVLRLAPKAAKPDELHLVAELAKTRQSAALAKGTLFKADKDSERKDRYYALSQETTFTRAKVAALMAVYRAEAADERLASDLRSSGRIFAAPVINSSDGVGGKLTSEMGDYHPFLNATPDAAGKIARIAMPAAELGFGISSHYLFLAEGKRHIRLLIESSQPFPAKVELRCRLTTKKGWFEPVLEVNERLHGTELHVELGPSDPAVTAFDPKVHGAGHEPGLPALQILLVNEAGSAFSYDQLKDVPVEGLRLEVSAGDSEAYQNDGIRQLTLAGKGGGLDPAKPFMPWGAAPTTGDPFILGSAEMFGKQGATFNIDVAWSNPPALSDPPSATLQFLEGGIWTPSQDVDQLGKSASQRLFSSAVAIPQAASVEDPSAPLVYNAASRGGFLRLVLDGDFGHAAYPAAYLEYTLDYNEYVKRGKTGDIPKPPPQPYTPTIDSLSCYYTAATDVALATPSNTPRTVRFYHVGPFGTAEQILPPSGSSNHRLVPQFRFPGKPDHVAEWYIGLEQSSGGQSLHLLIQVLEGTTLPRLTKPDQHVTWSYWATNRWVAFESVDISDGTLHLTRSGILSLAVPDDATTDLGIMPHGLLWLRASVSEAAGAVCRVLAVHAQALHAIFEDQGNAADALDQPLAAGTIKKLRTADAAFKKLSQPFSSFGGRPRETDEAFYLRSSERLRHKGRAITIWDYEHLVLAAFPEVHRVKCLHHTRIEDNPDSSLAIHNENAPGWVSVITLPRLQGRNDTQPLKPYAQQSTLGEIKAYLLERVSGQLAATASGPRICVCNPLFEELQLELKLKLAEGYLDFAFYSKLLADEITRFLTPWAFTDALEVSFGGRMPKSSLVDFIDERPYVDFVTDVVLRQRPEGGALSPDLEVAEATTSRSILVSAPALTHTIAPYAGGGS
jgi:hypothetical protein